MTILSYINWVDVLVLILLFRISYKGFFAGFSRDIVPLIGFFLALIFSLQFYAPFGNVIASYSLITIAYSKPLCYVVIVIITLFLTRVINTFVVNKVIRLEVSSIYDRIGGLLTGMAKGIIIASLVVTGLAILPNKYIAYSVKDKSLIAWYFINTGRNMHKKATIFFK